MPVAEVALPDPKGPEPYFGHGARQPSFFKTSTSEMAMLARRRINNWYRCWHHSDSADVLQRLRSNDEPQFFGAVWELYVNHLLQQMGFEVSRTPQAKSGSSPDFVATRNGQRFYVEATIIRDGLSTTEDRHWLQIKAALDEIRRTDYSIAIRPIKTSVNNPRIKHLKTELNSFLDGLDPVSSPMNEWAHEVITDGSWAFEVDAFSKGSDGNLGPILVMSGSGRAANIQDDINLKKKIIKKRKAYPGLDAPLVLAILENSFIAGDDNWHRLNALFGHEVLSLHEDGSTTMSRSLDGIWGPNNTVEKPVGLLLLGRLNLGQAQIQDPTLWINPIATCVADLRTNFGLGRYEVRNQQLEFATPVFTLEAN